MTVQQLKVSDELIEEITQDEAKVVENCEKVILVEPQDEIENESMRSEPPKDKTQEIPATLSGAPIPATAVVAC